MKSLFDLFPDPGFPYRGKELFPGMKFGHRGHAGNQWLVIEATPTMLTWKHIATGGIGYSTHIETEYDVWQ